MLQHIDVFGRVYVLHNAANDKFYVGQTTQPLIKRWRQHKKKCTAIRGHGIVAKAIQKYGKDAFSIDDIGFAFNKEQLDNLEKLWIILLRSSDRDLGYNCTFGGDGSLTEEARKKMRGPRPMTSLKLSGKKRPAEVMEKLRQFNLGRPHTLAWRKQHSIDMTGRCHTQETKAKMSEIKKKFWETKSHEERVKILRPAALASQGIT